MSLWNLDPRQAGVTEPDVEVYRAYDALGKPWIARRFVSDTVGSRLGAGPTEAAALRAAREAAGFGHVAEQPCLFYSRTSGPLIDECEQCAWPRDRHGKAAKADRRSGKAVAGA